LLCEKTSGIIRKIVSTMSSVALRGRISQLTRWRDKRASYK
jgi:hypothetical protein